MDLKSILPKKNEEEEHLWSLVIEPEWVSAGIWKFTNKKVQIVSVSPPSHWSSDEELVTACDTSCSAVVTSISEEIDPPAKTVFGVMSSWVDGGEIKAEYLSKIKKVCTELSLSPVGFVVISEALSNYYKLEEGGNVNAVFLGVSKESLEISIFKLGKLAGVSQVGRSVSIVDDVTEGLSRFYTGEAYPSRIILYNSKEGELEDVRQELVKADWESSEKVKFLHTPKIEIVQPDNKIFAVSLAGGSELGEVDGILALETPSSEKILDVKEDLAGGLPFSEETVLPDEPNLQEPVEEIAPEDFGFTVDTDAVSDNAPPVSNLPNVEAVEPIAEKTADMEGDSLNNNVRHEKKNLFSIFGKFKKVRSSQAKTPNMPVKFRIGSIKPTIFGIVFFLILVIGFFAFWWFVPSAEVTIYVSPQRIDDKTELTVDTLSEDSDLENMRISGQTIEDRVSGEKSIPSTGTKVIGDKATGEITVYRSGSEISLDKGALVKGPQGLNFTLDEDITIASGSVLTRGITKARVTASEIGAQYNLASGTTFTISNYSSADMEGTNESAFSGGSSREVSAVSDNDQKNLLKELQNELEEKLKESILGKASSDLFVIDDSINFTVVDKEYDKKVGDEASSLKLDLEIEASGIVVERETIEDIGLKYLSQRVPEGYTLKNDQIQADFTYKSEDDNLYVLDLFIGADLLPKIDIDEVKKNITGKFPDVAEEYLDNNVPGFSRVVIVFKGFRFPGKLGTLPRISSNIEISVGSEK
ncbi:MAG: hypothetical protein US97_C0014G0003 [Microgenomates group bacterium GW2011_GWF1_38_5]|nr:MAG: hypothetical protein US97_C0014G0003 [Microgenomates group bacterium GW2011_GWF1_38_5]